MRKFLLPALAAGTLTLGGCASGLGGMGGPYDPVSAVLGSVLGGATTSGGYGGYGGGYGGQNFQQAAVNACGQYASRYGQVGVRDVRQQSNTTLRVYGVVSDGYRQNDFACSYRSDGRITDFDL